MAVTETLPMVGEVERSETLPRIRSRNRSTTAHRFPGPAKAADQSPIEPLKQAVAKFHRVITPP